MLAACNARISAGTGDLDNGIDAPPGSPDAAVAGDDAAPDGPAPLGKWGAPTAIMIAATTDFDEDDATLSANGLEMIFARSPANGTGKDLFYASRATTADKFGALQALSINSTVSDETPRLSPDDKTLYYASGRGGGNTGLDIYMSTRAAAGSTTWSAPTRIASASSATTDKWYMPCGTRYIVAQTTAAGDTDLYEGVIGAAPVVVPELNTKGNETGTFLAKDCLTIYYASTGNANTAAQLYVSTRDALDSKWKTPTPVTDFPVGGKTTGQEDPWMSSDLRTFVFVSNANGTKDVFLSTR